MADQDSKNVPDPSYRFRLEIDGFDRAGFRECSGLDFSHDPIDYREGADPLSARKQIGLIKLKWGLSYDKELWEWRQEVMDGRVARRNGSIILLNDAGEEKMRWDFTAGWPAKWTGPNFDATGNEVAIETLRSCTRA
jgi:phage tail-like protein